MNWGKIIGLAAIIIGAIGLFFSDYIAKEVAAGRLQIQQGQKSVDTVNTLFSTSKYTKPFGKQFTGSAQKKIDSGKIDAAKYEMLSDQLRIGGIVVILIGLGIFFFWRKK